MIIEFCVRGCIAFIRFCIFKWLYDWWKLYRDCLRLVQYVAPGYSSKAKAIRGTVRAQFRKHQGETDPDKIEQYKADAIRALSNYLLTQQAQKDPKVAAAMKDYHGRSVQQAKQTDSYSRATTIPSSTSSGNEDENR